MNAGPVLVVIGIAIVAIGLLAWSGALSWFGHLPGDIRVQRDGFSFFMPITSMLAVSIALSLVFALVRRFFG
jgi:hypothetical protein